MISFVLHLPAQPPFSSLLGPLRSSLNLVLPPRLSLFRACVYLHICMQTSYRTVQIPFFILSAFLGIGVSVLLSTSMTMSSV